MFTWETLEYFVRSYGYWALLAGTFIEGETILLLGGIAAHMGFLDLGTVMIVSFIGSFAGDQTYFHIGRIKGQQLLARFPRWQLKANKAHRYLERYHNLIMLGFRFVYGIRIITPIVLALNPRLSTFRFVIFNMAGALLWSVVVAGGGYIFGRALEAILRDLQNVEIVLLCSLAALLLGVWLFIRYKNKKRAAYLTAERSRRNSEAD